MVTSFIKSIVAAGLVVVAATNAQAATRTVVGRVTAFSPSSISVLEHEVITVSLTNQTAFTKMVTQRPWEQDTRLDRRTLRVGQYVAVHRDRSDVGVARWVQVATDMPLATQVVAMAALGAPQMHEHQHAAADPKEKSADRLSPADVARLIAAAKTADDHRALAKHFDAEAAAYDASAAEHLAMAKAYRARPTASETKRPGSPDTSSHCDRLVELAQKSAAVARELANEHRAMADAAK